MVNFIPWFLGALSSRKLVVLGFTLGALPLVVALYFTFDAFNELDQLCRETVYGVVEQVKKAQTLTETLVDLERKSRQFLVLETPAAQSSYETVRMSFHVALAELRTDTHETKLLDGLNRLGNAESVLFNTLITPHLDKKEKVRLAEGFRSLYAEARNLWVGYSAAVEKRVEDMQGHSAALHNRLMERALILLSVSLVVVLAVTLVIQRAMRQLDHAIRQLGGGSFDKEVNVRGPKDMVYLGERLNWLRRRLLFLGEERQRFFRNISHELKTPLTTIHEGVELLADQVVGELNREQAEIAQLMSSSSQRLHKLIEDLTHFGQLNMEGLEKTQTRELVDMEKIVMSVIDDYQIRLKANSINLKLRSSKVVLNASPVELRTIVDNLLSNAVKYSPIGGEIRFFLGERNQSLLLEVEDDGPGIARHERDRIFEPFFQGESTRATGVRGSGLGLAIVRECVVAHRGSVVAVEPRHGKKGARLRVVIPIDHVTETADSV